MAENIIGRIIIILRTLDNISQDELAEALPYSRAHLSSAESGKKDPSLGLAKKLAHHFHLPLGLFVEGAMEIEEYRRILADRVANKFLDEILKSSKT